MKRLVWLLLLSLASGQEIRRPTTDTDPGNLGLGCFGTVQASAAMPKAYDAAGLPTFGSLLAIGSDTSANKKSRLFSGWSVFKSAYTALTLNVNATFPGAEGGGGACLRYSIDGGTTFTTLKCDSGNPFANQTYSVSLATTQDFSKLRIAGCAYGSKGNVRAEIDAGNDQILINDIWTAGTNPAPATGNGSTSGQPHRGAVVSN